jgi:hypothetical protein
MLLAASKAYISVEFLIAISDSSRSSSSLPPRSKAGLSLHINNILHSILRIHQVIAD